MAKSPRPKRARRTRPARPAKRSVKRSKPTKTASKGKVPKAARKLPKTRSPRRAQTKPRVAAKTVRKTAKRPTKRAATKPKGRSARPAKATKTTKAAPRARIVPAQTPIPVAPPAQPSAPSAPLAIALFGASGEIGSRIAEEAVARGHHVTALMRNPDQMTGTHANLRKVRANVTDPAQVAVVARSHDIVVSAISPPNNEPDVLSHAAKALLAGSKETGVRVIAVGGAGSLEVAPGVQLLDSPQFPSDWRPVAVAHRKALQAFRDGGAGVRWTVISPAAMITPGIRTGKYRKGTDQLVVGTDGQSRISMEDYAVALMDEVESGANVGRRIAVGY